MQEIFEKPSFFDIANFQNAELPLRTPYAEYEDKQMKSIFADKRNNGTNFRASFITSSSSHFSNKTDLEKYLLGLK